MRHSGVGSKVTMTRVLAALMLAAVAAQPAVAQQPVAGQATAVDSRIRIIPYNENRIITLRGHLGYQMLIEFDPAERIENVAIGDSLAWQVTPNRAATMIFLKPIVAGAATNMTVVTTLRRYSFDLRSQEATGPNDPNIIYSVRFTYPDVQAPPVPPPPPPPQPLNLDYTTQGSDRFGRVRVFDDGAMTYFQFSENIDTPAIFVIGERGEEELANVQMRSPYVVVDRVARGFVLRSGRYRMRITNEGFGRAASPEAQGTTP